MALYRVSVLVDGDQEERLAREHLAKNTPEDALSRYDGLLTGWATDIEIDEMKRSGLRVEASAAQAEPADISAISPHLESEEGSLVCATLRGPMRPEWRQILEENGVQMLGKTDVDTYRMQASREALSKMADARILRDVWIEGTTNKASREVRQEVESVAESEGVPEAVEGAMLGMEVPLGAAPSADSERPRAVYDVTVFKRAGLEVVRRKLKENEVQIIETAPRALRIEVPVGAPILKEIASWPEVRFVAKYDPPQLMCTAGNATIGVEALRSASPVRWTGKGEIVAVFDSGIDAGHLDLAPSVLPALPMSGARPNDDIGHGTHVAGIIAGRGTAGGPPGVAPEAQLIDRTMVDASGQLILPVNYEQLFGPAATAGAKIFNLSWGWPIGGSYDQGSRQVDEFAFSHPDILFVVAAGNAGRAPNGQFGFRSLAAPASAKNVITVGACTLRCTCATNCACKGTHGQKWPSFFSVPPASNEPLIAGNGDPVAVIGISSRGPTEHDSIKPDVLAPGLLVESTRSQYVQVPRFDTGCPCTDQNQYACMSGTSMAAPFVSGSAALLRQYLREERNMAAPSAALLKALLIAAATRLSHVRAGQQNFAGFPDFDQGFGMLNLSSLLPHPAAPAERRLMLFDVANDSPDALASRQPPDSPIRSFRSHRFKIAVPSTEPLRIVLCWTDPPGVSVQNNLQLDLTDPARAQPRLGNEDHKFRADPLGIDLADKLNNVEVIAVPNPTPGDYRARVFAQNTSLPNQGYALVIVGPVSS